MLKTLSAKHVPLLAILFSGALLLGAFAFEHIGGLKPCELCWYQRYAHMAVLVTAVMALIAQRAFQRRSLAVLTNLVVIIALAVSLYWAVFHVGVEKGVFSWTCGVPDNPMEGLTDGKSLLESLNEPMDVVLCDDVAWSMLGISMAGWNAIVSGLALLASLILTFRKAK